MIGTKKIISIYDCHFKVIVIVHKVYLRIETYQTDIHKKCIKKKLIENKFA